MLEQQQLHFFLNDILTLNNQEGEAAKNEARDPYFLKHLLLVVGSSKSSIKIKYPVMNSIKILINGQRHWKVLLI